MAKVPYTQISNGKKGRSPCRVACFAVLVIFLVLTSGIFLFVGIGGSCCFPLHASCDADWTFNKSCSEVQKALTDQITAWHSDDNCKKNGGEKCLYSLVSRTSAVLKATHETPKAHYVDNLTFTFMQNGGVCNVNGKSSSATWYALLDKGTNYCNLHNLITGSGLDKTPGYSEMTSNKKCTQYSSANCEVY